MDEQIKERYGPGKNGEGYPDPTAFEALRNINKEDKVFRPLVYICSPYKGDPEGNSKKARHYSRVAVNRNYIPFAPHLLLPQYLADDDPKERELAMFMNRVFLGKCNEIWIIGDKITEGMKEEITVAKRHRKVIRYFTEDMEEKSHELLQVPAKPGLNLESSQESGGM